MGVFDKLKQWMGDEDEDIEEVDTDGMDFVTKSEEETEEPAKRGNKVVNIHATAQLQVVLVKPERFDDASTVADHLNAKRTVVLNLESANKDVARRKVGGQRS